MKRPADLHNPFSPIRKIVSRTARIGVFAAGMMAHGVVTVLVVPAVMAPALLVPGTNAYAQVCPTEPLLQNFTGGGTVACPCFVPGEEAGVVLNAPAAHYPIEILKIGIGWGSVFSGNPAQLEQAIHIYPNALPNPGVAQFSLPGPQLNDGFINVFDIEPLIGNKIINSGPFTITLEMLNQSAGNQFASSVVHDGNGCQPGLNVVKVIPGGWNDACLLGVTGDWVMYVEYRQVNCVTCVPCPVNCPATDADGICPTPPNHTVDFDSDGIVGLVDLAAFAQAFAQQNNVCADYNCDGPINLVDLATFAIHFGHAGAQLGVCN